MNKNTGTIIAIVIVIVIFVVGGIYALTNNKDESVLKNKSLESKTITGDDSEMNKENESMVKDGKPTMEKDENKIASGDTMIKVGSYEAYSPEKIAKAQTGDVVLFFRASWCPTCRALDADIKSNLSKISENLTILDVNYDNSTELKKKYGVTYQHTFVQIDANGNQIKKWSGSQTLGDLIIEIK